MFEELEDIKSDAETVRELAGPRSEEDRQVEIALQKKAWFPYRIIDDPIEKTQQFVLAFNDAASASLHRAPESFKGDIRTRKYLKASGIYLKRSELISPWVEERRDEFNCLRLYVSKRWKHWVRARRYADLMSLDYGDYVNGAINAAIKRNWPGMPNPAQLSNPKIIGAGPGSDRFRDATIIGYVDGLYSESIRITTHPYFSGASYIGNVHQNDYIGYVARQIVSKYGNTQRASRAWAGYQSRGQIPSSVSLCAAILLSSRAE